MSLPSYITLAVGLGALAASAVAAPTGANPADAFAHTKEFRNATPDARQRNFALPSETVHLTSADKIPSFFAPSVKTALSSLVDIGWGPRIQVPLYPWHAALQKCTSGQPLGTAKQIPQGDYQLVTSIELGDVDLTFSVEDPLVPTLTSDGVVIGLQLPTGFIEATNAQFESMDQTSYVDFSPGGHFPAAFFSVNDVPASGPHGFRKGLNNQGFDSMQASANLNNVDFAAVVDAEDTFMQLIRRVTVARGAVPIYFNGEANMKVSISNPSHYELCFNGITFDTQSALTGFGGLTEVEVLNTPKLVGGDPETGLHLTLDILIENPSNIKLSAGEITLDLQYEGATVGSVVFDNFVLPPGPTIFNNVRSFFNPDLSDPNARQAGFNLLSAFTGGDDNIIVNVVGTAKSSPISSLIPALEALNIPAKLPSNKIPLLDKSFLLANKFATFDAALISNNPFNTPLSIVGIESSIVLPASAAASPILNPINVPSGAILATINFNFPSAFPYAFESGQKSVRSNPVPLNATNDGADYTQGLVLGSNPPPSNTLPIFTSSILTVNVGGYIAKFSYEQSTFLDYGCDFIGTGSAPFFPVCPLVGVPVGAKRRETAEPAGPSHLPSKSEHGIAAELSRSVCAELPTAVQVLK
ncbi:hypothetical protein BDK51DRAFT_39958 [Blyttiomyces helicus]|uniref:Uncharacterized protein n=1 Tax=Blyttiomyces helicus TaxID=388810 RepID=A0A4P9W5H3_9FUNG|nr:hypothetical protein BDK51DRAFT_39958 [Blyttiomyces helicus]|eukprot:RKO86000.1 hypothetical protein BDK51DRAFT_39958 [Blyttiomyces helicus]